MGCNRENQRLDKRRKTRTLKEEPGKAAILGAFVRTCGNRTCIKRRAGPGTGARLSVSANRDQLHWKLPCCGPGMRVCTHLTKELAMGFAPAEGGAVQSCGPVKEGSHRLLGWGYPVYEQRVVSLGSTVAAFGESLLG